tara:strand:- start:707 stop:928 length:222 start_codon:yes stop_codon:yes gene_type:complete
MIDLEAFKEQIIEILELDEYDPSLALDEIEAYDSLGVLAIMAMCESQFNITNIDPEVFEKFKKISDLEDILRS